ncbi:universal stress protein [Actinoallomurus liliacearum]|uniref:Universal stress protein n=1 Tax=Actinoallomurus liliacearum TaxID=1080073 RepID=A0ABP8TG94_9ACTN
MADGGWRMATERSAAGTGEETTLVNEILAGTDGSDSGTAATRWAAEEAGRRALPLRILHAVAPWLYETPVDPRFASIRTWLLSQGRTVVDEAVAAARERAPGVEIEGELVPGPATRILLERAGAAAMVVLGGRGVGAAAGLLLGSTTLQVVAHAPVPVVVVRSLQPPARREVVIGVDTAATGEAAIAMAFEEAALRTALLRVMHAWWHPASTAPGDIQPLVYDPQVMAEDELRRIEEALVPWRGKFPGVEVIPEAVHGRAARVLADASEGAELLVVGTRGRGGFKGLLLGSVSHALLHRAKCPLAVVPAGR